MDTNKKQLEEIKRQNDEMDKTMKEFIKQLDEQIAEIEELEKKEKAANMSTNENDMFEDINRKNEIFIRDLMDKGIFMLNWSSGNIIPINDPNYYDSSTEVNIRRNYSDSYGDIRFKRDKYEVTEEVVSNLYNYVKTNLDKLIKITLNQTTDMFDGVIDYLSIKFKSLYISISEFNASSEEEVNEIRKIKEDIKKIICVNKIASGGSDENSISDEQIETL